MAVPGRFAEAGSIRRRLGLSNGGFKSRKAHSGVNTAPNGGGAGHELGP